MSSLLLVRVTDYCRFVLNLFGISWHRRSVAGFLLGWFSEFGDLGNVMLIEHKILLVYDLEMVRLDKTSMRKLRWRW